LAGGIATITSKIISYCTISSYRKTILQLADWMKVLFTMAVTEDLYPFESKMTELRASQP
jgi:hypothetical protein